MQIVESEKNRNNNYQEMDKQQNKQTEAMKNKGFVPVLKNRRFLILWIGQIFSQIADKVYLVLMIAIIASNFQGENHTISGWVSAIMIALTIPAILFGSLAGVYVDRWSKKGVLVVSNLLRGVLVLAIPVLLWLSGNKSLFQGFPIGIWRSDRGNICCFYLHTVFCPSRTSDYSSNC